MGARFARVGLVAVVTALALAPASMASSARFGFSRIQREGENCGGREVGKPFIGSVLFERTGNTVTMLVQLTKGLPDTEYAIELWTSPVCGEVGTAGTLLTDSAGRGTGLGSIELPAEDAKVRRFFATLYGDADYNDSLVVSLP